MPRSKREDISPPFRTSASPASPLPWSGQSDCTALRLPHQPRSKGASHHGNHHHQRYGNVSLSLLIESKTNPRRIFEGAALKELSESIRTQGVLSPLLVRPLTENGFEIVAGARRYRAARMIKPPQSVDLIVESRLAFLVLQTLRSSHRTCAITGLHEVRMRLATLAQILDKLPLRLEILHPSRIPVSGAASSVAIRGGEALESTRWTANRRLARWTATLVATIGTEMFGWISRGVEEHLVYKG